MTAIAFSPDGKALASGEVGGQVRLWHLGQRKASWHARDEEAGVVYAVAFSPDGKTVAAGREDGTIRLLEAATGQERGRLQGHRGQVSAVALSPRDRILASGGGDGMIRLWDVSSMAAVASLEGHQGKVSSLTFSADGRWLVSGSRDKTALVWDVRSRDRAARLRFMLLSPGELERLWADLAGPNAHKADRAIWRLVAAPGQALPLIRERVKPAGRSDSERLARLIADLDNEDFARRERASRELEALGKSAEPTLRRLLASCPSEEAKRRAERLLEKVQEGIPSGELLQALRAIEVLENMGSAEAHQVLEALANGSPDARVTQEAKATLKRLAKPAAR